MMDHTDRNTGTGTSPDTHTHTDERRQTHLRPTCAATNAHTHTRARGHTATHKGTHTHTRTRTHAHTHTRKHTHTHTRTHAHTHTHTFSFVVVFLFFSFFFFLFSRILFRDLERDVKFLRPGCDTLKLTVKRGVFPRFHFSFFWRGWLGCGRQSLCHRFPNIATTTLTQTRRCQARSLSFACAPRAFPYVFPLLDG